MTPTGLEALRRRLRHPDPGRAARHRDRAQPDLVRRPRRRRHRSCPDGRRLVDIERGVSDGGLGAGGGRFGFETLLQHIDWLHARGKAVLFDAYTEDRHGAEYNMATYFLVNGTRDALRTNYRHTPDDWWSGYDVDLGAAKGDRYESDGLLRRDFANGYVLVNQPGRPPVTVPPPAPRPRRRAAQRGDATRRPGCRRGRRPAPHRGAGPGQARDQPGQRGRAEGPRRHRRPQGQGGQPQGQGQGPSHRPPLRAGQGQGPQGRRPARPRSGSRSAAAPASAGWPSAPPP